MTLPLPRLDRSRKKELRRFEKALGVRFRKPARLQWALQHRSFVNENPELKLAHNERLEYLGDSVLGLVTAHRLFEKYPDFSEGKLSMLKSALVNREVLTELALEYGLGEFLLLGKGESRGGGRRRSSILADAFEAVIGALYLDRGYKSCAKFLTQIFERRIETAAAEELHSANPKNLLQKKTQALFGGLPEYAVESEQGPQHRKVFTVIVSGQGRELGRGAGPTKKKAEEAAAREALKQFRKS